MQGKNIKELNSQLEGIIMGENQFIKLKEKAKDYKLIELLDNALKTVEKHKAIIINEIKELGGETTDNEGLLGKMIEIFSNLKEMSIDSDEEILKTAIKGTEMGFKGILDMLIKEEDFHMHLKKSLIEISEDYAKHIKEMQEYLISK